ERLVGMRRTRRLAQLALTPIVRQGELIEIGRNPKAATRASAACLAAVAARVPAPTERGRLELAPLLQDGGVDLGDDAALLVLVAQLRGLDAAAQRLVDGLVEGHVHGHL